LPPPAAPFARAKTVNASLDLGKDVLLEVDLGFAEEAHAKDAEQMIEQLRAMGKKFLGEGKREMDRKLAESKRIVPIWDFEKVGEVVGPVYMLGMIKRGEEILAGIPVSRDKGRVIIKLTMPEELTGYASSLPIMVGLLVPAVQKVREAAARLQGANNLKQLALAMHSHHDAYKKFPAAICDKDGKPLLSWRVAILPFIEEGKLYGEFELDEPWDSEHNKKLLQRMPKILQMPDGSGAAEFRTHYRVFVGPDAVPSALFRTYNDKVSFRKITDGSSNTLMIVEAADSVPWTKPEELVYDPKGPLPRLYRRGPQSGATVAFADGSVRTLPALLPEATLRALITRDGGEVANFDE